MQDIKAINNMNNSKNQNTENFKYICSCSSWTNDSENMKCPDCGDVVEQVVLNESVMESLKEVC